MGGHRQAQPRGAGELHGTTRGQALGRLCGRSLILDEVRSTDPVSAPQDSLHEGGERLYGVLCGRSLLLGSVRSTGEGGTGTGCFLRRPKMTRFADFRGPKNDLLDAEGVHARAAGK
jgi:hypothetical protein